MVKQSQLDHNTTGSASLRVGWSEYAGAGIAGGGLRWNARIEKNAPDKQVSLTDPDARSMKTRGNGSVGYNVQTAVDAEHRLIVTHEVTNEGSDRSQLSPMAKQARDAIGANDLTVVADAGYFKSHEILACHQAGITPFVRKIETFGKRAKGCFERKEFRYLPEMDEYRCHANEALKWCMTSEEAGKTLHRYWSSSCPACSLKSQSDG